ncbi:MAG: four helix bundle protein [Anaerolineales bacterium]|nr:four helix bundle protein [Anaerolineales bacterium]MCB8992156.1 four helix bundle protein [Ardenticatenaceae bacterium]
MQKKPVSFDDWQKSVHGSLRNDPLWAFQVYPKALFIYDLAWEDCDYLRQDVRGESVAKQLIRSAGSISANIEEGFGRGFGNDYAFRLRIALGEAREARGWYWKGHKLIPAEVLNHRIKLLDEIIAMLPPNIDKQRHYKRS